MLQEKLKGLFKKMWVLGDNTEAMYEFVELVEEFTDWNRGDVRVALIDLHDYGFPIGEKIVAYDDMGGCMDTTIYFPHDFIELMIDTYDEYRDEEYLENFWIPRLEELIEKYY